MVVFTPAGVIIGGVVAVVGGVASHTDYSDYSDHHNYSDHSNYSDYAERQARLRQSQRESKRKQIERLENEVRNCFSEGFDGLRSLYDVSKLPTIKDAASRQAYYREHMDEFKRGVMQDVQKKLESALSADRAELKKIDQAIAAINAMQLNSKD